MRVFYDKKTGKVIGTVEGFSTDPALDSVMIVPGGYKKEDIGVENIGIGHEHESLVREFEDAKNPKNVLNYKIEKMGKKILVEKK